MATDCHTIRSASARRVAKDCLRDAAPIDRGDRRRSRHKRSYGHARCPPCMVASPSPDTCFKIVVKISQTAATHPAGRSFRRGFSVFRHDEQRSGDVPSRGTDRPGDSRPLRIASRAAHFRGHAPWTCPGFAAVVPRLLPNFGSSKTFRPGDKERIDVEKNIADLRPDVGCHHSVRLRRRPRLAP